ncbi:MAG: TetR/AcrR family transcriptional regulator [Dermatophilaceae bacterium]
MTPRATALHPEERRAAIVEVALPLLREHGAALTTKQVADAAGIAEGTLFRAFGTKEELVKACCATVFDDTKVVEAITAIDRELPLESRLTAAIALCQEHLGTVIELIFALRSGGMPPGVLPDRPPRRTGTGSGTGTGSSGRSARKRDGERIDAALTDVIDTDAELLRLPVQRVVDVLANLTMASVHPMFRARSLTAAEIVSVVLDGTRRA